MDLLILTGKSQYELDWLAPGHGFLIAEPSRAVEALLAHRRAREAEVVAALERADGAEIDALLLLVYDDVRPALHAAARLSLAAQLEHLERRRLARRDGARWFAAGG